MRDLSEVLGEKQRELIECKIDIYCLKRILPLVDERVKEKPAGVPEPIMAAIANEEQILEESQPVEVPAKKQWP